MISKIKNWLAGLFLNPQDQYLGMATDLADFERRQRVLERGNDLYLFDRGCY